MLLLTASVDMIGRQMLGRIKYKVDEALGAERSSVGLLTSMGGKDVMLSGDPDQAAPIGDDSFHKEGASRKGKATPSSLRAMGIHDRKERSGSCIKVHDLRSVCAT